MWCDTPLEISVPPARFLSSSFLQQPQLFNLGELDERFPIYFSFVRRVQEKRSAVG